MNRSIIISSVLHAALIYITAMSLPFLAKKPLDIPPIVSVELIQIAEKTNIPFAPKAKKIIEKAKEKEKKLVSEQAPPKKVKKTKTKTVVSVDKNEKIDSKAPDAIPLPKKTVKKMETKTENKQNPDKLDEEVKQVSEFEKKGGTVDVISLDDEHGQLAPTERMLSAMFAYDTEDERVVYLANEMQARYQKDSKYAARLAATGKKPLIYFSDDRLIGMERVTMHGMNI